MKRILSNTIIIVAVLMIVASTFIYLSGRLGFRVDAVISDSMKPTLNVGTMVISKTVPASELKVNDIIIFKPILEGELPIVHRIVEIENTVPRTFKTKGDNPSQAIDPWLVPEANIIGKLQFNVSVIGYYASFARSKLGLILTLIVPSLVIIVMIFRSLWRELVSYVKNKPVRED